MALVGDRLALIADRADIGKLLKKQFKNQIVSALGRSNLLLEPRLMAASILPSIRLIAVSTLPSSRVIASSRRRISARVANSIVGIARRGGINFLQLGPRGRGV
jgi:hypothetical protein